LWKVGFLVIAAAAVAAVCFLLFINVSVSAALVSCGLSAAFTAAAVYSLLYFPNDSRLTELIVDADIASREAQTQLRNVKANDGLRIIELELRDLNTEKLQLLETIRREIESGIRRRAELLQLNWRAMRDNEWENYLVEVFKALGAKAERIGCSGDQGCDLIVEAGTMRIAVQAKGYHNSVGNSAVQEAFAGMHYHGCSMCAVITNSRFTQSAQELAVSTRCVLISEQQIPDFVMGQVEFFPLCNLSTM
jgi:HJR/Mrr/RecB family endonuclease